jgi:hypothetical protein
MHCLYSVIFQSKSKALNQMPPRRRAQRQQNEAAEAGSENEAATGRAARGARGQAARGGRSGFIQASDLPANYQGGQPPHQAQVGAGRVPQIEFPWSIEDPLRYDFNMDDALMAVRWLPHGQRFSDEELEEYIIERLADFEEALEEQEEQADYEMGVPEALHRIRELQRILSGH